MNGATLADRVAAALERQRRGEMAERAADFAGELEPLVVADSSGHGGAGHAVCGCGRADVRDALFAVLVDLRHALRLLDGAGDRGRAAAAVARVEARVGELYVDAVFGPTAPATPETAGTRFPAGWDRLG